MAGVSTFLFVFFIIYHYFKNESLWWNTVWINVLLIKYIEKVSIYYFNIKIKLIDKKLWIRLIQVN